MDRDEWFIAIMSIIALLACLTAISSCERLSKPTRSYTQLHAATLNYTNS